MSSPQRILIVDDSETNRVVLRVQLESMGYGVLDATDGIDALAVLERERVDAVIADILMPRMDGYRLCQEIRRHERLRDLPIIVYTATYVSSDDEKLAHRSGADRYLVKPAPMAALQTTVAEVLRAPPASTRPPFSPDEQMVMREYNAVLINKLEEKTRELEARNTELAAVNAELEESRARAAGIIASAMDAMVTVDPDGRILLFNGAAEAMFLVPAGQMIGQPLERLLPKRLNLKAGAPILGGDTAAATSQELSARGAITGVRIGGQEFPIEASLSRVEVAGRKLVTVILRDVTERQRTEDELRRASAQMRALAQRLEHIREEERTRIAREIHDVLAQELTRLKIDLVWLAKGVTKAIDEPTRASLGLRIKDALVQTDVAITTVQRIATELRPVILDSLGLPAAVEWQADDFSRRTGIACHATTPGREFALDRERATALFRILQESLTNIARHAQATLIDLQLVAGRDYVALTVRDNGRGIAAAQLADPLSIGLAGMRERAQAFGGTVEIATAGAGGTVVAVRLPLEESAGSPPSP